jgi:acetate kinase
MAMEELILVANPGSSSRKYALFKGEKQLAQLHFEHEDGQVVCTLVTGAHQRKVDVQASDLADSSNHIIPVLKKHGMLPDGVKIQRIGLRVVAPTSFFLEDHVMTDDVVAQLEAVRPRAPLHIEATLGELRVLKERFPDTTIVGVSDSAFHSTKPDFAWTYGLPIADADRLDIKRFGYHGISAASVINSLKSAGKLPYKVIICHLGSGASITAVLHGQSRDTSMGYSPLEGLIMATRSGTIDWTAARVLKDSLGLDDAGLEEYLNRKSGLLGLSGSSSDIRELLKKELEGDHYAGLALRAYVFSVQKFIGQMAAALGGVDLLAFIGTVGERSPLIRERVVKPLHYLDLTLDADTNEQCVAPDNPACISRLAQSKPIFVVPADEEKEIAARALAAT